MFKRIAIVLLLTLSFVGASPAVAVPAASELNPEQIGSIKQNCRQVQQSLRDLQKRDTVLRINRGRLYDMTLRQTGAFTSRLDVQKIDAPAIKEAQSKLRAEYQNFILDYDRYGDYLTAAIAIDCASKPNEFYASLAQAAETRKVVAADVSLLKRYLGEYNNELGKLQESKFGTENTNEQ